MKWPRIDEVLASVAGKSAVATKKFSAHEAFFSDHFPGNPVVPGVLQIELIAQTGGHAIRQARPDWFLVLSVVRRTWFFHPIFPEEVMEIHATVANLEESGTLVNATISVGGRKVSEAQLVLSAVPSGSRDPALKKAERGKS